jgi:hypothetical protein
MLSLNPGKLRVTAGLALLFTTSAPAQVTIFSENFDTGLSPGANFSKYVFGDTDAATSTAAIAAGVGVGGTPAWQIINNAPSGANGFSGIGAQYQNGGIIEVLEEAGQHKIVWNIPKAIPDRRATSDSLGSVAAHPKAWPRGSLCGGEDVPLGELPALPPPQAQSDAANRQERY